jgi:SARP family transcriptional regulator, regulator of embCAB operon
MQFGLYVRTLTNDTSICVNILGPLELFEHGEHLVVPGEKLRTIIAVLALNAPKPVSSDDLIGELWMESAPTNPGNALQAHIARIRRIFRDHVRSTDPDNIISTTPTGYELHLPECSVDSNRFTQLVTDGRRLMSADPAEAVRLLEQALLLWRGAALLDTGDGPLCRSAALWLENARLVAQEDLFEAKLDLGLHQTVVGELEYLVAQNPLRERFADALMRAFYLCGCPASALSLYKRTRERLVRELGIEPSHILKDRYQMILGHDPSLRLVRAGN